MSDVLLGIEEIDRKYEILGRMGAGGMGAVYKVRHKYLEEVRVIKTIQAQLRDREDSQKRFLREARMASQLRHPGIAQTYDFGVGENGVAFIVMEFVDGTDLTHVLDRDELLPVADTVAIADQTLEILDYLHSRRVVHRDISPDNIMLTTGRDGSPRIKLIDLGIAKPLEASQHYTRTGTFVGKLLYASPEQLSDTQSHTVGPASDLYSFGLVLYQLLTGTFPIPGDTEATIIAGHLLHAPRAFDETDPGGRVPAGLRAVVLTALAKSTEERFADAATFRAELRRAAGMEVEQIRRHLRTSIALARPTAAPTAEPARPPTVLGKTLPVGRRKAAGRREDRRPSRRRWLVAAAGAAIVAALGLGWWWSRDASPGAGGPTAGATRHPPPPRDGGGRQPAPPPLAGLDFGAYHALVIGNDRYRQLPALRSAVADATGVAAVLEERYGFQVRLLTDATRREIIDALTEVTSELTSRDNLLIYYAGHGFLDSQNQSGYWQPVDAEPANTSNWISTRHEISAVLGRLPVQHVLVVADSCYSGSLTEPMSAPLEPLPPGPEHAQRVRELLERRSRLALTSGGLHPVLDEGDGRHSVFSKVLLETLTGNARLLEASRLFGLIRDEVARAAARYGVEQDPQLAPISLAGDEGGEFFFVPVEPQA